MAAKIERYNAEQKVWIPVETLKRGGELNGCVPNRIGKRTEFIFFNLAPDNSGTTIYRTTKPYPRKMEKLKEISQPHRTELTEVGILHPGEPFEMKLRTELGKTRLRITHLKRKIRSPR